MLGSKQLLLKLLGHSPFAKKNQIAIVYYVYINPDKNWKRLVLDQIKDVKSTKVLEVADLYIVVSNPTHAKDVESFFSEIKHFYKEIKFYTENKFEYWGMLLVWRIAQECKHYKYLVYFHTKGMTHPERKRVKVEELLTLTLFNQWTSLIEIFQKNNQINKMGLFPACKVNAQREILRGGWIWYNFWWARAEYIRTLEQPKSHPKHRYYYEEWLSYLKTDSKAKFYDNFSIYSMDLSLYSNKEVLDTTETLLKQPNLRQATQA